MKLYALLLSVLLLVAAATSDNDWIIGDGANTDKCVKANVGDGTSNPYLCYDASADTWVKSDDGVSSNPLGSGSGGGGAAGISIYEPDGTFESGPSSISAWSTFADTDATLSAATITGGTSSDVSITHVTTGSILSGSAQANIEYTDASSEYDGAFVYLGTDDRIESGTAKVSFLYKTAAGSRYVRFVVYDLTNDEVLLSSETEGTMSMLISGDSNYFEGTFNYTSGASTVLIFQAIGQVNVDFDLDELNVTVLDDTVELKKATGNRVNNPGFEKMNSGWYTFDTDDTSDPDSISETSPDSLNVLALTEAFSSGSTYEAISGNRSVAFFPTSDGLDYRGEGMAYNFKIDKTDHNKVLGLEFDYHAVDLGFGVIDTGEVSVYIQNNCSGSSDEGEVLPLLYTDDSLSSPYHIPITSADTDLHYKAGWVPQSDCDYYKVLVMMSTSSLSVAQPLIFDNFEVGSATVHAGFDGIWKAYDQNTVTFSNTPAGWSLKWAEFTPQKLTNGKWILDFQMYATATAAVNFSFDIDGIVSKNETDFYQALTSGEAPTSQSTNQAYIGPNDNTIFLRYDGGTETQIMLGGRIYLESKPTWADFDPIATIYPTTDDLAYQVYSIDGQEELNQADGVATDVDSGTVTVPAGTYSLEYGAQGRVTYGTVPTGVQWALAVVDSADTSIAGVTSSMAPATSTLMRGNIDSFIEVTFTEETTLNLISTITVSGGASISGRNTYYGYIKLTRLDATSLPPIGLQIATEDIYGTTKQQKVLTDSRASGSALALTSSTAANVTASGVTLTPGTWELKARVGYTGTATNVGTVILGATTTSGTTPSVDDRDIGRQVGHDLSAANLNFAFYSRTVTVTSDTTYYLVTFQTFSGGTCSVFGELVANRIIE